MREHPLRHERRKWRKKRLRKKYHLCEFQERGLGLSVSYARELNHDEEEALHDQFGVFISHQRLYFGGHLRGGAFVHRAKGSVSEEDRARIERWLESRPEINGPDVGPLVDAWYPPENKGRKNG